MNLDKYLYIFSELTFVNTISTEFIFNLFGEKIIILLNTIPNKSILSQIEQISH